MSKLSEEQLDLIFSALSDRTRRSILKKVQVQECSVKDLVENYDMSFQAVAKHLNVLEKAHLINKRKSGRHYYSSLNEKQLTQALNWISKQYDFWNSSFSSLDEFLNAQDDDTK
ncbi:metalloregulator ArsR/SmtB family transcription factor [Fulvivirgaceae bacterium BMA10]|uniref:Metalloregulator ArsR/SmtB family transcription factor n=1 Tax=Splendidivirga corallicola TaxID=3051826 RepID=A0ABT8KVQ2_9BACT|nr:metalloregulator ArsR/SmtB family transcription factor [Fulvivirgaceae bacterium BMA10]